MSCGARGSGGTLGWLNVENYYTQIECGGRFGVLWRTGIPRREHGASVPNEDSEFHLKGKESFWFTLGCHMISYGF